MNSMAYMKKALIDWYASNAVIRLLVGVGILGLVIIDIYFIFIQFGD